MSHRSKSHPRSLTYPRWQRMPLSRLAPNERNPRTITNEALGRLTRSLAELGNLSPVTFNVRTGRLVGGHQRLKCLQAMGHTETDAWCVDLPEEKESAAMLALNNSAGEWDDDGLAELLKELQEDGANLELTGFPDAELERLVQELGGDEPAADAEPQLDRADELNATWKVQPGDLWQIGRHRLLCGDSTDPDAVARVLAGAKPRLMVTDPPYGVNYDPAWRNKVMRADGSRVAARATGRVQNDDRADWQAAWALFPGDVVYCWHGGLHAGAVAASLVGAGFDIRAQIVWAKHRFVISRGNYHWQHEPCWYAVRRGRAGSWKGDRTQTTLWEIAHNASETGHGTQKPLECMARPIRNHAGDVYEPFAGSGTTLVAAENLGRTCHAIELHPPYCAVILERMKTAFPGIKIGRQPAAKPGKRRASEAGPQTPPTA